MYAVFRRRSIDGNYAIKIAAGLTREAAEALCDQRAAASENDVSAFLAGVYFEVVDQARLP